LSVLLFAVLLAELLSEVRVTSPLFAALLVVPL
jgi:hypothetical protein